MHRSAFKTPRRQLTRISTWCWMLLSVCTMLLSVCTMISCSYRTGTPFMREFIPISGSTHTSRTLSGPLMAPTSQRPSPLQIMATFRITSTPCHRTSLLPVALGFHPSTSSPAGSAQRTTTAYLLTLSSEGSSFPATILLGGCRLRKDNRSLAPYRGLRYHLRE